jgi:hypothetical protein
MFFLTIFFCDRNSLDSFSFSFFDPKLPKSEKQFVNPPLQLEDMIHFAKYVVKEISSKKQIDMHLLEKNVKYLLIAKNDRKKMFEREWER